MDQSLVAGIGNVYSDEILFQCGWHPRRGTNDLSEEELRELRRTMRRVLRTATRNDALPEKFPHGYLLAHRRTDKRCPNCGTERSSG